MKKHHRLQLLLFFVYILVATGMMLRLGIGITPDRYLVVLLAGAFLIRHSKNFIHDFAPFILIIIGYDFIRSFADILNPKVDYLLPINLTNFIFHGQNLTVLLQQKFYTNGSLHWYDFGASYLYLLHFAVPLVLAFLIWLKNRKGFREVMLGLSLLSYGSLIIYLIHPTAPPWLASQHGYLPHITKISDVVIAHQFLD